MAHLFVPITLLAALTACSSPEEMSEELLVEAKAAANADGTTARATSGEGAAREVKVENDQYQFEYSYPLAAGSVAGLKAYLDDDLEKTQNEFAADAKEAQGDAEEFSYPFRPHSLTSAWEVVADLPGWISLSRESWAYTGGAHGNSFTSGLVWDKENARAMAPIDLFSSGAALETALSENYCAALNEQRRERRGEGADAGIFDECPKLEELTVLVGSSNGETFDRIGLIADPYVAGSFAEGPYEVTLPVDAAILGAVKPAYRTAFSTKG